MTVTVLGRSGLTNAYTSVLSAYGSSVMSGASRWLPSYSKNSRPGTAPEAAASVPSAATSDRSLLNLCMAFLLPVVSRLPYRAREGREPQVLTRRGILVWGRGVRALSEGGARPTFAEGRGSRPVIYLWLGKVRMPAGTRFDLLTAEV